ncbi:Tfp pilus assembly protein PilP [Hahella chejuensis KCTC 2396]|uniref:Tfp pilus assembly protein PilP n=1 Tax=Hahella chejuensis (strain KCTC 2396) TaxID=349521 RepID=Q2S9Q3_HAHCH|nr:pilus assembly protein PilP [Hahella chejuensis]ABC32621.1 Tfp pilus assembly protein PilP [Hahella chejuensis KCTC 2396]
MKRLILISALIVFFGGLSGCSSSGGFDDLQAFVQEVKARPKKRIEPLPEPKAYQAFSYSTANRRSPFAPPQELKLAQIEDKPKSSVKPDLNRPPELLESFAIGSMSMVGTINKDGENTLYALVNDGQGGIHRVRKGQYMGKNHGRVVAISDVGIDIVEIVSDGQGGWFERPRTLGLKEVN